MAEIQAVGNQPPQASTFVDTPPVGNASAEARGATAFSLRPPGLQLTQTPLGRRPQKLDLFLQPDRAVPAVEFGLYSLASIFTAMGIGFAVGSEPTASNFDIGMGAVGTGAALLFIAGGYSLACRLGADCRDRSESNGYALRPTGNGFQVTF